MVNFIDLHQYDSVRGFEIIVNAFGDIKGEGGGVRVPLEQPFGKLFRRYGWGDYLRILQLGRRYLMVDGLLRDL
jgi:hypothetical protein